MNKYMELAIREARGGIESKHGGPFGTVIVKDGEIVGRGHNCVIVNNDPTCHGEVAAIRDACRNLGTYDLRGCELYTTAEPCHMCLCACMWAHVSKIYYGCNIEDTDSIGFRDKQFYEAPEDISEELHREECLEVFTEYKALKNKKHY
jgi:guanine deaminase